MKLVVANWNKHHSVYSRQRNPPPQFLKESPPHTHTIFRREDTLINSSVPIHVELNVFHSDMIKITHIFHDKKGIYAHFFLSKCIENKVFSNAGIASLTLKKELGVHKKLSCASFGKNLWRNEERVNEYLIIRAVFCQGCVFRAIDTLFCSLTQLSRGSSDAC